MQMNTSIQTSKIQRESLTALGCIIIQIFSRIQRDSWTALGCIIIQTFRIQRKSLTAVGCIIIQTLSRIQRIFDSSWLSAKGTLISASVGRPSGGDVIADKCIKELVAYLFDSYLATKRRLHLSWSLSTALPFYTEDNHKRTNTEIISRKCGTQQCSGIRVFLTCA